MKKEIAVLLKDILKKSKVNLGIEEIQTRIEIPQSSEIGDYAFPCFFLAGKLKSNSHQIALELREEIGNPGKEFERIEVSGAYINFFLNKETFTKEVLNEVFKKEKDFGKIENKKPKKVVIEFPSPNTNKPLHLGHLRNMAIGESISRVKEFANDKVIRVNLNNDRGIHICKSMLAYKKFGKNAKPKGKSDHAVGDYYVMFSKKVADNPNLEAEAQEMLRKWEQGDEETKSLWKKMNKWALEGFDETYNVFGIKHDKEYFESDIYDEGKKIVEEGLKKKVFEKKTDGAVVINLEKEGLGEKVLLRADGTAIYITQDIQLAKEKEKNYNPDESIILTANEQDYHFNVLLTILKKLGYKFADYTKHTSYGMVFLPEGKMKSREGTVVDADDLIEKVKELVKKHIKKNKKLPKREIESRSLKIALAAIKYWLLKIEMKKDTTFYPKESINFEGNTGPYLLYTYARANSILEKSKKNKKIPGKINLGEKDYELAKKINQFKEVVSNSYRELNPSLIANYSYELAKTFNEFYHSSKVINSNEEEFRLALVDATKVILKNSLSLLGIETIEKM